MASRRPQTELETLIAQLRNVAGHLVQLDRTENVRAAKKARAALDEVSAQLTGLSAGLDPILRPQSMFDPTDPKTAGRVVALTLVAQSMHPLASIPLFYGAGIYAIYYKGSFSPYSPLAGTDHPIYVGKADPDNPAAASAIAQGTKIASRLNDHAKNIRKAESTLDINDFTCRFLIVQTGFQKSAEDYLIEFFKPIWNSETKIAYGLGKHGDSATTRANKRSPWDTLHPGRPWADETTTDQKSAADIRQQIDQHFANFPPYRDIHKIFDQFMNDMRQLSPERFQTPEGSSIEIKESPPPDGSEN